MPRVVTEPLSRGALAVLEASRPPEVRAAVPAMGLHVAVPAKPGTAGAHGLVVYACACCGEVSGGKRVTRSLN